MIYLHRTGYFLNKAKTVINFIPCYNLKKLFDKTFATQFHGLTSENAPEKGISVLLSGEV